LAKAGIFRYNQAMTDPVEPTKPSAGTIPAPNEIARCVVMLNRQKTPVTAHVTIPATNETLYSATQLSSESETALSGAATNAKGDAAGQITVNRLPASNDPSQSLRPVSCDVDGKTYPVKLPDSIEKRLFPTPGSGIS
jgi:hypothetical protein